VVAPKTGGKPKTAVASAKTEKQSLTK